MKRFQGHIDKVGSWSGCWGRRVMGVLIGRNHNPTCFLDMTLIFSLTSRLLHLISKSKDIETILDLSTIKLEELFEDTISTQCNHTLFVLVKWVKIIFQTQLPLLYPTSSVDGGISYLLLSVLHVIFPMKTGTHNLQLNNTHQTFYTARTFYKLH